MKIFGAHSHSESLTDHCHPPVTSVIGELKCNSASMIVIGPSFIRPDIPTQLLHLLILLRLGNCIRNGDKLVARLSSSSLYFRAHCSTQLMRNYYSREYRLSRYGFDTCVSNDNSASSASPLIHMTRVRLDDSRRLMLKSHFFQLHSRTRSLNACDGRISILQ